MNFEQMKPFLMKWVSKFDKRVTVALNGPQLIADSLSTDNLPLHDYQSLDFREQKVVTAFRHLRRDSRLNMSKRVLEEWHLKNKKVT